jgi:DNA-binding protein HU-beta
MNKNELIARVAKDAKLTNRDASAVIEATLENIIKALKGGDEVRLVGFGTFTVSRRKGSEGRNPRTGEAISIPASLNPKFKAGKLLKEAVSS